MKKLYMIPRVEVVKMNVHQMICGSITSDGDTLGVTISSEDSGSFGEDNTINSRGGFWEDE